MNTIPVYGNNNGGGDGEGCCPYLQLFKGGKLISTSVPVDENHAKTKAEGSNKALLQWSKASDGCVSFNVDCALQGDILLRARHASRHRESTRLGVNQSIPVWTKTNIA